MRTPIVDFFFFINSREERGGCNCRVKGNCPVGGQCLKSGVIYQAEVKSDNNKIETYIGLSENSFKDRLTKHRKSMNTEGYHKNTFSNHIWDLKRKRINFELSWRIVAMVKPYSPATKACELCIKEISYILFERNMASLNKKNEFYGSCLHKLEYLLKNQ